MQALIENNFFTAPEPHKSCLLFLRDFILGYSELITEKWSFNTPFYYYNNKSVCFISFHVKTGTIYLSFTNGHMLKHKKLLSEGRRKMKIFYVNPGKDIDVESLNNILHQAISV